MIISIMGYGKGKTESAVGCAIRAVTNKEKVLFIQFLKDGSALECKFFEERLPQWVTVYSAGSKKITLAKNVTQDDKELQRDLLDLTARSITYGSYGLVVLDEILPALDLGLISWEKFLELVKLCNKKHCDIYLTGRVRSHELRENIRNISDICTDAYCKKHCFDSKCSSCDNTYPYYFEYCPQCGEQLIPSKPAKKGRDF